MKRAAYRASAVSLLVGGLSLLSVAPVASAQMNTAGSLAMFAEPGQCHFDEDDFLSAWEFMDPGREDCHVIMSRGTRYRLVLFRDGRFEFYDHWNNQTLWKKKFLSGSKVQLDGEGRLISYYPTGGGFYFSDKIVQGAVLKIQDDGKMVFYTPGFAPKAQNCTKTLPFRYDWCRI